MGFFLDFVSFGGFRNAFVIYIFHLKKRKEKEKKKLLSWSIEL